MADTEPIIGNGASGILPEGLANMQKHPPKAQTIMDLTRARCSRLVLGLTALGVVAATNVADAKMTSGVAPVPTDGTGTAEISTKSLSEAEFIADIRMSAPMRKVYDLLSQKEKAIVVQYYGEGIQDSPNMPQTDKKRFAAALISFRESLVNMKEYVSEQSKGNAAFSFKGGVSLESSGKTIEKYLKRYGNRFTSEGKHLDDATSAFQMKAIQALDEKGRQLDEDIAREKERGRQLDEKGRQLDEKGRQLDEDIRLLDDLIAAIDSIR